MAKQFTKSIQQDDQLLTIADVSNLLQRSRRTIYTDVAMGRIPAPLRIGRAIRWRRADIATAIERLTQ